MISPNQSNIYNDNKKKKSTRSVSFAETDGDYSGGEDEADGDSSSSENNNCSSPENDDSSTSSDGSGDSWNHLLLWCSSFYLLNEVLLVWSPEVHILLLNYRVCANSTPQPGNSFSIHDTFCPPFKWRFILVLKWPASLLFEIWILLRIISAVCTLVFSDF